MNSRPDPMIGRVLHGTIELKRLIGRGGMGAVYEGYQAHLERRVAVKIMTPEHARNPIAAEYFIREAKQSSAIRHPNIIQILDFGKEGDILFLAMEFVPGVPLSSIMGEHALIPMRISQILDQMLAALEEAHENQIVHRDLKPDNVMIEQKRDGSDFVKILDFGIAQSRATQPAGPLTQAGALVGTPHYMSPEQAEGKLLDGRSDLFSVGVILYELLTGELPFTGNSLPQILINVIQKDPAPPLRDGKTVDPALEAICLRALAKNPDLRYQSAQRFGRHSKIWGSPLWRSLKLRLHNSFLSGRIARRRQSRMTPSSSGRLPCLPPRTYQPRISRPKLSILQGFLTPCAACFLKQKTRLGLL